MIQSSQILNSQLKRHNKNTPEPADSYNTQNSKGFDKMHSTETSLGDISQDLIKQLTLKNKLLNAQLVEYKTLVSNLNARLQQAEQQNQRLQNQLGLRIQKTAKLHTIEQQLHSMSEITTKSRRRDEQQMKQQYYFHQFTQLLNSHQLINHNMDWESYIATIEELLYERKDYLSFIQRIRQMKNSIQSTGGQTDLGGIWEWLKKIGLNYYYLLNHRRLRGKQSKEK